MTHHCTPTQHHSTSYTAPYTIEHRKVVDDAAVSLCLSSANEPGPQAYVFTDGIVRLCAAIADEDVMEAYVSSSSAVTPMVGAQLMTVAGAGVDGTWIGEGTIAGRARPAFTMRERGYFWAKRRNVQRKRMRDIRPMSVAL
eukprot:gene453-biopygen3389